MGSFPMKVSFVWPFPRSSKMVTAYAPSMASCSIPNCAGSILFPFESEKYMEETIFSCRTISWYSPAFQNSCPSGALMQQRNFPPTRKSISQKGAVKPFGPHHCITYFGFVHASQTNARGASKTLVTTICHAGDQFVLWIVFFQALKVREECCIFRPPVGIEEKNTLRQLLLRCPMDDTSKRSDANPTCEKNSYARQILTNQISGWPFDLHSGPNRHRLQHAFECRVAHPRGH